MECMMLMAGVQPNSITFLGLLCGCSHQGLVEEGVEYFHMMNLKFNLKPGIKHYGCMVDLFGRAGKLEKALDMIGNSPSQDDPVLWHGIAKMRKLIKSQGIKTTPGWSWIEVGDQIHKFVVDDKSHPDFFEIYHKLREVISQAALLGYVPEESLISVAGLITEECLETSTSYHSEKLAIAFGLARTPKGTSIRIVKNLRVCKDCHSFTKYVSKAFNREIIVRDRVRFHHFKGGVCSCKDYW
ncbi:pentatricopeptide repeat-containing protein [Quercus suber]|uniref:Pentatricopeptide repeat-containing protein n=1 Tax=Quercus suber TaxID=58331 RepID=A0AAW0KBN7_QUESU